MTRTSSSAAALGAAGVPSSRGSFPSRVAWFVALLLIGGAMRASAATYYVDNTNAAASDAGPGTTSTPYRTLSAAISQRGAAGNVIRALAGTYREQISLSVNGAAGSPVVIEGASQAVVIDGADDFSSAGQWTLVSGNVWLASGVTWAPVQVFADGARLTASIAAPASLPNGTFQYLAGTGLYVNAGGGNPAGHATKVGRRRYGFSGYGRSWITIRGFSVLRSEEAAVNLGSASNNCEITDCLLSYIGSAAVQLVGCSTIRIARNTITLNADHGISFGGGTTGCTVEDNESSFNVYPPARQANGIDLFNSPGNRIQRNRFHHNQDTGLNLRSGSNGNLCIGNVSWSNGDHGYDNLLSTGNLHLNEIAWGNYRDGFSIEGTSTGTQVLNCIGVDNGLTTGEYDLWVDAGSAPGLVSDDNLFWNSTGQAPFRYLTTIHSTLASYVTASGQDTRSLQVDPQFLNAANGDFHLRGGSRAIDSGNSSNGNWPATDTDGRARIDDPATANSGLGAVSYSDRGAFEFVPAQPPNGTIDTPGVNVSVAQGQSVAFSGSASDPDNQTPFTYLWDFGGGASNRTVEDPGAVTFNTVGVFTVTFRVTDAGGLADPTPATRTVTVTGSDRPPAVTAPSSRTIAENSTLTFSVSASDPDGQTITALVMDASGLPSGHHATFVAGSGNTSGTFSWQPGSSDSGSWKVTFRATANGASGQAVTSIRVTNVDRAPVMTAPGTVRVTRGSVATVNVTASDPDGDAITQLVADLSELPSGNNAVFVSGSGNTSGRLTWTTHSADNGRWKVYFTARNALSKSATTTIRVQSGVADGAAEETEGLPQAIALSGAFPNPAGGTVSFRLALPAAGEVEWSVVDVQGREVWRGRDSRSPGWSTIEWDGRTLAGARAGAGIYLVRVRAGESLVFVKRFVRL